MEEEKPLLTEKEVQMFAIENLEEIDKVKI